MSGSGTALTLRRGVGRTLVVVDALDPLAPEGCLLGLRQNEAVLDRDAGLVVVTVRDPGLERTS